MKTTFSRRELYALGEPIGDGATRVKPGGHGRVYGMGGGGGGPTQTTSTSYQTNIPEYAKPYVETMLGATQKQLFQGTPTEGGGFDITGFQPYKAYGGTYDESGKQTSYDPSKGIAGFQPMQTAAQQGVAGMQVPGQYRQAMGVTGQGIMGQLGTAGQGVGLSGLGYEAAGTGGQYARQATDPNAIQAYMSPYMQNVVDIQQREAQRQADIAGTQRGAQAVKAGAFGGSRQAIMDAEAARSLAQQKGDIQATGLQSAFQQAQQAQQYGANLGLQGLQAGMQGVGAGIGAQQAGYGQAMQGAQNLAALGGQQLKEQQGIYNLQSQFGAQQQAQEQQILNQAIQDYANAQQYPLMQLGTMSNMIRGLPMQSQTTQQYQAQPNMLTQGIGALGAGASLYNAFNPQTKTGASGGLPSEFKNSGIMSYDMGGEVESDLESASDEFLNRQIKESSSTSVKRMAQRILRERQMSKGMAGGGIIAFREPTKENNQSLVTSEEPAAVKEPTSSEILQRRVMLGQPTGDVTEKPLGIIQAAPPPPPAPSPTPEQNIQQSSNIPAQVKDLYTQQAAKSAQPLSEFRKEVQEEYKNAGVAQRSPEERSKLMQERANAEDEAKRTRYIRMAEFFAEFGSTPGPTIVAGLNAFKSKVPSLIADEKEARKIRMEIDKSIAGFDEATRLEDRGLVDKAAKRKQEAIDATQKTYMKIIEMEDAANKAAKATQVQAERDTRTAEREKEKDIRYGDLQREITQMKIDSEERTKRAIRDATEASKSEASVNRLTTLFTNTSQDAANTEAKIQNTMKTTEYQDLVRAASPPTSENPSAAALKIYETAKKQLADVHQSFEDQRRAVKESRAFIAAQLKSKGIDVTPQTPPTATNRSPGGNAKRGGANRPSLDDPSLQR